MTPDVFLALALFAAATVFTPGPNNLMLMASGVNFGLRRSLGHVAGVAYGFPFMILPVGMGVMQVFDLWPVTRPILQAVSVAYVLWLAWKIAHAGAPGTAGTRARPLSFLQAAAFQWVNPKAWSMALGAVTLYAAGRDFAGVATIAATYAVIGTASALSWTLLGQSLQRWLSVPARLRLFNRAMALLLIAAMIPLIRG